MEAAPGHDIVAGNTVVSFDGRVLELFGHAARQGNRIHVALITGVAIDAAKAVVSVRGGSDYSIVLSGLDDATRAAVEGLMEQVKRSAPGV
ncbi:hypothetical protein [Streptacidiphilus melanogenes]|uniref:hypothetical protein n=1 Tax=Streptacidiphilus melanogenes TaxID=411235 RepID=UPI0005AB1B31|nr:hypothetical protein [Streptacidiphilus melanogenes]